MFHFNRWLVRLMLGFSLLSIIFLFLQSHLLNLNSIIVEDVVNSALSSRSSFETHKLSVIPSEASIETRTSELLEIYHSIKNEMILLEQKRRALLETTSQLENQVGSLRNSVQLASKNLTRLEATISSYMKSSLASSDDTIVKDFPPLCTVREISSFDPSSRSTLLTNESVGFHCSMSSCFSWERCPLNSPFLRVCFSASNSSSRFVNFWMKALIKAPQFKNSCSDACVMIVFDNEGAQNCLVRNTSSFEFSALSCIFINDGNTDSLSKLKNSKLLLASSNFQQASYSETSHRYKYDFLLASNILPSVKLPESFPPLSGSRIFLLGASVGQQNLFPNALHYSQMLSLFLNQTRDDKRISVLVQSNMSLCRPSGSNDSFVSDWILCHDADRVLGNSTFGLIVAGWWTIPVGRTNASFSSTESLQVQLSACLENGAIPVLVTDNYLVQEENSLPFWEVLHSHWRRAAIFIPMARLPILLDIISSIDVAHLVEMRRRGQYMWRKFLSTPESQLSTLFLALSHRLGLIQPAIPLYKATPAIPTGRQEGVFENLSFHPTDYYEPRASVLAQVDVDDLLGPLGPQRDSRSNRRSQTITDSLSQTLDSLVDPFWSHSSLPWDPFLPSEYQFLTQNSVSDFRPINHTFGTAGMEFSSDLGGMHPYEQFTVVMLCYNRTSIALLSIEGLANLPYLHSVIIVWNGPEHPPPGLRWPKLQAPIYVINGSRNSLNNRFLPYDIIKTDCILMLDDDVQLRHDEIIFGFRVWRENRDRLVGFPARAHFWSAETQDWYYNSDYSCEVSMILTGASFLHRYYLHAYSTEMNERIRQIVDERMNCEDIAMNFLVAHITRKPPIKVTTHWSFLCHRCSSTLYSRPQHKESRAACINQFSAIYGYNPLIYTQFRADSMLFKTRLPSTKQKCFKYV